MKNSVMTHPEGGRLICTVQTAMSADCQPQHKRQRLLRLNVQRHRVCSILVLGIHSEVSPGVQHIR